MKSKTNPFLGAFTNSNLMEHLTKLKSKKDADVVSESKEPGDCAVLPRPEQVAKFTFEVLSLDDVKIVGEPDDVLAFEKEMAECENEFFVMHFGAQYIMPYTQATSVSGPNYVGIYEPDKGTCLIINVKLACYILKLKYL